MEGAEGGTPTLEEGPEGSAGAAASALEQLLGPSLSVDGFFADVWEQGPRVIRCGVDGARARGSGDEGAGPASLLPWGDLLGVLQRAQEPGRPADVDVLVMKEGCPSTDYESCQAAYLDGCSLIVNHLDKVHGPVNAFCRGLRRHIPHAFANMYLTPPESQAVAAHADDRDVMVLQVAGSKRWKVYPDPPVPLPYPREQAGKSAAYPVPQVLLDSQPLIECTLHAGDVLYMPRGFVHEACTGGAAASLHLTFAMATHDWSWASVVAAALLGTGKESEECSQLRARLERQEHCPRGAWWWRRSMPPALICSGMPDSIRKAANDLAASASSELARELGADLSAELMTAVLGAKVAQHNARQDQSAPSATMPRLSLCTFVRRFTDEEKASLQREQPQRQQEQQGLVVRDEIAAALLRTLAGITTTPVQISSFEDADLVCTFSKICFAAVCMDQGLLCACDGSGEQIDTSSLRPRQLSSGDVRAGGRAGGRGRAKKRKRKQQPPGQEEGAGMART